MSKTANYIIGIDLGTTNCTMTASKVDAELIDVIQLDQVPILQATEAHTIDQPLSLPSFIYFPLEEEVKGNIGQLPWSSNGHFMVGTYARDRGAELPTRLIASAKSWLCHAGVDRRENLLPIESDEIDHRMSPLTACAEILKHLRASWDQNHPDAPFNEQEVLVTVPASFDPSARQLVQEAAEMASYPEVILLEEPQAAFYAWLQQHSKEWRTNLKVGDTVLVIDIGGGTTDFSLIGVEEKAGDLELRRLAVGAHLLLGGDNIDLALAYFVKGKFEEQGHEIDHWQFQTLIHQCRQAKEQLMGENPPDHIAVTVLGRGSRLIGNTLTVELSLKDVEHLILDGFFPLVEMEERSPVEHRAGIQQIGLPYVQDPRISCQLAKFLSMTGETEKAATDQFVLPTAVLFNGGTLKAFSFRQRLMTLLNQWAKKLDKPPVLELRGADYDFAVSRGAACYGLARQGKAIRIRGGTSRSYYIGVEESAPAVPGMSPPLRACCIVPFGLEEGEERELGEQEFALILGEQATFRFFSHSTPLLSDGREPIVGTSVRNWKQELTELHPIETVLSKAEGDGKTVRVKLKSKVTELGVLELWCFAPDGRKWKLEFDIRQ
jgi:hypothetical protein